MRLWTAGTATLALTVFAFAVRAPSPVSSRGLPSVRIACFPNLTHAVGLAALAQGRFAKAVAGAAQVEPRLFGAGPEAMEALLAGEVDMAYVGPSPAVNAYLKSGGRALKIVAGSCGGGASLVARRAAGITELKHLSGRRLAVPQLGGTQDVAARMFLGRLGLKPAERGGAVQILPVKPADVQGLFLRGELDAAWVPEPWATRLAQQPGCLRVLDERDLWPGRRFSTTVVVMRRAFMEHHAEWAERLLQAHLETTDWVKADRQGAQAVVNAELKRLTGSLLPEGVMQEAWSRLEFTSEPDEAAVQSITQGAAEAGYLKSGSGDLTGLFELRMHGRARQRMAAKP
jgi:NitT/TauT family transport system substrate-binding protein